MYHNNDILIISESHREGNRYYEKAENTWKLFSCVKRFNFSKALEKYKEAILNYRKSRIKDNRLFECFDKLIICAEKIKMSTWWFIDTYNSYYNLYLTENNTSFSFDLKKLEKITDNLLLKYEEYGSFEKCAELQEELAQIFSKKLFDHEKEIQYYQKACHYYSLNDDDYNNTKIIRCKEKLAEIQTKKSNFLAAYNLYREIADRYIDLNKKVYLLISRKFALLAVVTGLLSRFPGLNLIEYLTEVKDRNTSFIQSSEYDIAIILIEIKRQQNIDLSSKLKIHSSYFNINPIVEGLIHELLDTYNQNEDPLL